MATGKRLNEVKNPVIDFGQADSEHKLLLPKNTTSSLAEITPNEVGSLAFDTTQNKVVINDGTGFAPVSSGGGGGGADTDLSNLTSPTAINQNLTFGAGVTDPTISSAPGKNLIVTIGQGPGSSLTINTPDDSDGSAAIEISTGSVDSGSSGQIELFTGDVSGDGISGDIHLFAGQALDGDASRGRVLTDGSGFQLPQKNAKPDTSDAQEGDMYYDVTTHSPWYFNGTAWQEM